MAEGSSPARTIMFVAGTRPEVLKLAPVIHALRSGARLRVRLCATAQHRELLDGALADFGLAADADLGLMRDGQTPAAVTAAVVAALGPMLAANPPAALVVQGDTALVARGGGTARAGSSATSPSRERKRWKVRTATSARPAEDAASALPPSLPARMATRKSRTCSWPAAAGSVMPSERR